MRPVEALIDKPAGRPVADQVSVPAGAVAVICREPAVPTLVDWLPGGLTVTCVTIVQVGSAAWAGTLTASHAALTALKFAQLPGVRFLAAVSVQVRYFRYDEPVVFVSIALYMILPAVWMPTPTRPVLPLQVVLVGWPLVGLVPSASR